MKKNLFLLISLIFLFGAGSASAAFESATYDFEDYKTDHAAPSGWGMQDSYHAYPVKVDDAHGTSLKLSKTAFPTYTFPETISSGKFLMSFEINFQNFNCNMRMHLYSPTTGKDSHSIAYFSTKGQFCDAQSGTSDWSFTRMADLELDRWYQVDILIDMDEHKMYYYLDGEELSNITTKFVDFSNLKFRTENHGSTEETLFYMDNVTFKYVAPGTFGTNYDNKVASSTENLLYVNFTDLVDQNTLGGLKVYNMGNNPIEYSEKEVSYTIKEKSPKMLTLELAEKFGECNIYKVYIPGAKSLFGDYFKNESAYFATGGAFGQVRTINSDFSTIPEFDKTYGNKVDPASDGVEWTKGGTSYIYPTHTTDLDEEGTSTIVVKFVGNKATTKAPTNLMTLERALGKAYSGEVGIEYKIKAKNGNQSFRVKDSDEQTFDVVTIKADGIYSGETKISDYTSDVWFDLKIDIDFDSGKADIYKDGKLIAEDIDVTGVKDISSAIFVQENAAEYGKDESDKFAESEIAYFRLLTMKERPSVTLINFEDESGNIYYPDEKIPSVVTKMNIAFSEDLKTATLENSFKLSNNGVDEILDGTYNKSSKKYVVEFPQYLAGSETYTLEISDDITGESGSNIKAVNGNFKTQTGVVKAKNLTFSAANGEADLSTNIIHTDASCPNVYLIYAAYDDDMLIDFKYEVISPDADERNISVNKNYSYPSEADTISAFLWDGFDTMLPMAKMQTKSE